MGLLRHRGFLQLWAGQLVSTLADWALRTILLIWVYALTHSGVAVSVVGLAEALPLLLLAPVAGVFVDRWSRAATMAGAALARVLLVLPLLAVSSRAGVPLLVAVTLFANVAAQFFVAAASAAVPVVVGPERAGAANSLLSLVFGTVLTVGPGLGALLFGAVGPHRSVLVIGLLYAMAAPVLSRVPAHRPAPDGTVGPSLGREMSEGVRYVWRSALLRAVIAVAMVGYLGAGALNVLDVVFVTRALHLHAESVGVLFIAVGIGTVGGGLAMSLASAVLARRYHLVLGGAVLAQGLLCIAYGLAPTLAAAAFLGFLIGLLWSPSLAAIFTLLQLASADAVLGRVTSLYSMCTAAAMIVSMACGGALADQVGVRQVIAGCAVLITVAGAASLLLIRATPLSQTPPIASEMGDAVAAVAV
jgi:MFS family permease